MSMANNRVMAEELFWSLIIVRLLRLGGRVILPVTHLLLC